MSAIEIIVVVGWSLFAVLVFLLNEAERHDRPHRRHRKT